MVMVAVARVVVVARVAAVALSAVADMAGTVGMEGVARLVVGEAASACTPCSAHSNPLPSRYYTSLPKGYSVPILCSTILRSRFLGGSAMVAARVGAAMTVDLKGVAKVLAVTASKVVVVVVATKAVGA
jgi:hypothetical protein